MPKLRRRKTCLVCRKALTPMQRRRGGKFCSVQHSRKWSRENGNPAGSNAGAPTLRDDPGIVAKLIQAYQRGLNHSEAAMVAGVDRTTVADWIAKDEEFARKIERARTFPTRRAKEVVVESINNGDTKNARWWLERKARREFATRQEHAGAPDQPIEQVIYYRPKKLPAGYWKEDDNNPQSAPTPVKTVDKSGKKEDK